MAKRILRVSDFSGGRNTRDARNAVQPFQSPGDLNMVATSPDQIRRRKGFVWWVNKTFGTFNIRGLFRYVQKAGTKYLMVAAGTKLWACKGDYPYTDYIEVTGGLDATLERHFAQMQDNVYMSAHTSAIWTASENPLRWNGTSVVDFGHAYISQTSAITCTPNAAGGSITFTSAASYEYTYIFVNYYGELGEGPSDYGMTEFELGTVSINSPGASTAGSVAISGLSAARDPVATHVAIYRTLNQQRPNTGVYLIARVLAGTDTYTDAFNDSSLLTLQPDQPLFNRDYPPQFAYICAHRNRMFIAKVNTKELTPTGLDGPGGPDHTLYDTYEYHSRVYWSDLYQPDRIMGFLDVQPDDGAAISGLASYLNKLIIFKENSIWALYGTSPDDFELRPLDPRIGCVAPRTIVVGDNVLHFLSRDGVYIYDGNGIQRISDEIQPDINSMSAGRLTGACAGWHDGKYFISIPEAV